jgi:hypothetical protein
MSLTETPPTAERVLDSPRTEADHQSSPTPSSRRPLGPTLAWVGIGAALLGLAVLVGNAVQSESEPAPVRSQMISDPKDRPGYRSPTINRPLTTGDPKDWPGYGPITGDPRVGDPKDRPGYRSPTIDRPLTTGDAKDWPGYGSVTGHFPTPVTGTD